MSFVVCCSLTLDFRLFVVVHCLWFVVVVCRSFFEVPRSLLCGLRCVVCCVCCLLLLFVVVGCVLFVVRCSSFVFLL